MKSSDLNLDSFPKDFCPNCGDKLKIIDSNISPLPTGYRKFFICDNNCYLLSVIQYPTSFIEALAIRSVNEKDDLLLVYNDHKTEICYRNVQIDLDPKHFISKKSKELKEIYSNTLYKIDLLK